jgi:hypothetical protein
MRRITLALAVIAATAVAASAQGPQVRPEIRPFVGMYIPTGVQRDLFDDAAMYGVQAAFELRPSFHVLGTFGWVPGQSKYQTASNDVQIFQYDVGIEWNMVRALGDAWLVKPFVGLGTGARTYVYDSDNLKNRTCSAGYGALGTEFELNRAAIRLEGRDNVFCFRSAVPGVKSKTRNDVGLSLGLAYHFR